MVVRLAELLGSATEPTERQVGVLNAYLGGTYARDAERCAILGALRALLEGHAELLLSCGLAETVLEAFRAGHPLLK